MCSEKRYLFMKCDLIEKHNKLMWNEDWFNSSQGRKSNTKDKVFYLTDLLVKPRTTTTTRTVTHCSPWCFIRWSSTSLELPQSVVWRNGRKWKSIFQITAQLSTKDTNDSLLFFSSTWCVASIVGFDHWPWKQRIPRSTAVLFGWVSRAIRFHEWFCNRLVL